MEAPMVQSMTASRSVYNSPIKIEDTAITDEMSEADPIIAHVNTRAQKMISARAPFVIEWDYIDKQVNSKSFYDNDGRLIVNCAVEQSLLEFHSGRVSQKLNYDVTSVGIQPDNMEEKAGKYVLANTLERDNWWQEDKIWEYDRGKYGTAFLVTFPEMNIVKDINTVPGDVDEDGAGYFSTKTVATYSERWKFAPRNWPIRQVLLDDRAIWQSKLEKVRDMILIETITLDELKMRFRDEKLFNIE